MLSILKSILNWLCLFNLKSFTGSIIGVLIISPIGFFFGLTIGAILGGGWTASLIELLFGLKGGKIAGVMVILGSIQMVVGGVVGYYFGSSHGSQDKPVSRPPGQETRSKTDSKT